MPQMIPPESRSCNMTETQRNNPLHGKTLEMILTELVEDIGWDQLGLRIDVRCFNYDPSIKSSLKFLRRTPWARTKVEDLYIEMQEGMDPQGGATR